MRGVAGGGVVMAAVVDKSALENSCWALQQVLERCRAVLGRYRHLHLTYRSCLLAEAGGGLAHGLEFDLLMEELDTADCVSQEA